MNEEPVGESMGSAREDQLDGEQSREPAVLEAEVDATNPWWDELNATAVARTTLITKLFPSDVGASILPSAEATLYLPGLVDWTVEEEQQTQFALDVIPAAEAEPKVAVMTGEPISEECLGPDKSWGQLMTYVESLTDAVLSAEPVESADESHWLLGSEQPTPD